MKKKLLFLFLCALILSMGTWPFSMKKCIATNISAECVMDAESRRILFQSHGDTRLPMASTTKIVTAISVLESGLPLQKTVNISKEAAGVEGSSVYLKEGEEYTVEALLYGLMLRSGNDCAVALALETDGSIERFSTRMNETAERAGALSSRFRNPHGLPKNGHYTTANDLSLITSYALKNDIFRKIVSTQYYQPKGWENKNKMLHLYDGALGVKTGYTKEAGRCLVSAAEKNGLLLVCTLLNRYDTYERSIKLLDDAFAAYRKVELLKSGEIFEGESDGKKIKGKTKEAFSYPLMEEEIPCVERVIIPYKVEEQEEIIGQIQIFLSKRLLFCGFLYKL